MRPAENIKKFVKNRKPDIFTGADFDKRVLNDSFTAMEKAMRARSVVNQPNIWRIIMKGKITKFAIAAIIIVAALIGINQFGSSVDINGSSLVAELVEGPCVHTFADGSQVELTEGAKIRLYNGTDRRGFEHVAGEVEVVVKNSDKEFVITSVFGTVKALGTAFKMDIFYVDSTELLAVKVKKGTVEVSNPQGTVVIKENQGATVERDQRPYDFRQDKNLPPRLVYRIESMLMAMETGDKQMWLSNFNIKTLYDLAKGKIEYAQHPDWFSGMVPDDANHFREALSDVNSPEQLADMMLSEISDKTYKLYVRSVALDKDGKHATAICVRKQGQAIGFTPQWTFFEGDWWQTDD